MMRLRLAIVDNFERREEVAKKLEEAEHRVQGTEQAPSNNEAEHASLQQLSGKDADTIVSEAERLYKEVNNLGDQLDEATKQRRAILERKAQG